MTLNYRMLFDPRAQLTTPLAPLSASDRADRTTASAYLFPAEAVLAVNVALATGRPILVRGPSGVGKSTLARATAAKISWSYVETTITSRSEARDLLYTVDELARLRDAQAGEDVRNLVRYLTPGPFFWAFDPRAAQEMLDAFERGKLRPSGVRLDAPSTVVLIDEIDKADPDLPNNLLEPLGRLAFSVPELGKGITATAAPLVFITTNEERDLPVAFLRRCVELGLDVPSREDLLAIALEHLALAGKTMSKKALEEIAEEVATALQSSPSTAEFLDAVRAHDVLEASPGGDAFKAVMRQVLWKHGRRRK